MSDNSDDPELGSLLRKGDGHRASKTFAGTRQVGSQASPLFQRPVRQDFDGLLCVGHGTRDPAGIAEFQRLVAQVVRQRPDWAVEGCFLELAKPSISAGLRALAMRGARRVQAMPLVLFAAGHAKRDIPQALVVAAREFPDLHVEQAPHLGLHSAILELSERRFREAIGDQSPGLARDTVWALDNICAKGAVLEPNKVPAANEAAMQDTLLVLVGRGSSDRQATIEMRRLANLRRQRPPVGRIDTAFVAMAEPPLDEVLKRAAESVYSRVVVQPHLLFSGLVLSAVRAKVERWATLAPEKRWMTADPLGPDEAVIRAILDIVG